MLKRDYKLLIVGSALGIAATCALQAFAGDKLISDINNNDIEIKNGIKVHNVNIPKRDVFQINESDEICGYDNDGITKIIEHYIVEYTDGITTEKPVYGANCTLNELLVE